VESTAAFEQLLYEERGDVAYLTLNRPKARNALSMRLSDELVAAIEQVRVTRELKFVVIRGSGDNFCVGDDLKEMAEGAWGDANEYLHRVRHYQNMAYALEELDKITIAAVDGFAVGGGLEVTMACDFVIATERARWGMPEVDTGITPGWGGTTRLPRLIGRRLAKEINMIGALHPARRAVELTLWNRMVPNDGLDAEVDKLLDVLRTKNQQTLRQLKFILNKGVEADLYTAQGFEALSAGLSAAANGWWQIPDHDQGAGLKGFVNKDGTWTTRRPVAIDFWAD
jgi:enoyl-CoA hydratase/carnithine racemase